MAVSFSSSPPPKALPTALPTALPKALPNSLLMTPPLASLFSTATTSGDGDFSSDEDACFGGLAKGIRQLKISDDATTSTYICPPITAVDGVPIATAYAPGLNQCHPLENRRTDPQPLSANTPVTPQLAKRMHDLRRVLEWNPVSDLILSNSNFSVHEIVSQIVAQTILPLNLPVGLPLNLPLNLPVGETTARNFRKDCLWSLCNIAAGSHSFTAAVVEAGGIQAVVGALQHADSCADEEMIEICMWALGNICGDCTEFRVAVLTLASLGRLLEIIFAASRAASTRRVSYWLLSNCCRLPCQGSLSVAWPPILQAMVVGVVRNPPAADDLEAWNHAGECVAAAVERIVKSPSSGDPIEGLLDRAVSRATISSIGLFARLFYSAVSSRLVVPAESRLSTEQYVSILLLASLCTAGPTLLLEAATIVRAEAPNLPTFLLSLTATPRSLINSSALSAAHFRLWQALNQVVPELQLPFAVETAKAIVGSRPSASQWHTVTLPDLFFMAMESLCADFSLRNSQGVRLGTNFAAQEQLMLFVRAAGCVVVNHRSSTEQKENALLILVRITTALPDTDAADLILESYASHRDLLRQIAQPLYELLCCEAAGPLLTTEERSSLCNVWLNVIPSVLTQNSSHVG